ncbi:response regulator transcription factor [Neglectibacter caecimuris]|uniref:response regulator transcription factor n=1 Tax=Neglectibacter caecimuris TaxID=3093658 RepID=UPI002AC8DB19|nr:helix-turn-helix domain-containing protein [Neglectibacter sp. M00184]
MRVLIVDDQLHVVNGIAAGIDWDKLGVTETLCAHSAFEARQIFSEHPVDVMLCDIEMPVESGISLYHWVKEQKFATECIFLTAHADFSYAREALRLESFDYILQPARYEEIQNALARAISHLKAKRELALYSSYGHGVSKNRSALLDGIFQDCLLNRENKLSDLRARAGQCGIPFSGGQKSACGLLQPLSWEKGTAPWEEEVLRYALDNILTELFHTYRYSLLLVRAQDDFYLLASPPEGSPYRQETVQNQLAAFLTVSQRELGLSAACYWTELEPGSSLAGGAEKLQARKKDNILLSGGLFFVGEASGAESPVSFESQLKRWEHFLTGGNVLPVREEIHLWLEKNAGENRLTARDLKYFYQGLIRMFSVAADQRQIHFQEILSSSELLDQYLTAYESVDGVKNLVDHVIPYFLEDPTEENQKQIDRAIQYIYDHIDKEINCAEIARHVFLNPDYLSRVFKKETGLSLKKFIILEKMKLAKSLLRSTALPISTISLRVGYSNFSHFSQSYKKAMGLTPEEERRA